MLKYACRRIGSTLRFKVYHRCQREERPMEREKETERRRNEENPIRENIPRQNCGPLSLCDSPSFKPLFLFLSLSLSASRYINPSPPKIEPIDIDWIVRVVRVYLCILKIITTSDES